jgi:hypothetical protein
MIQVGPMEAVEDGPGAWKVRHLEQGYSYRTFGDEAKLRAALEKQGAPKEKTSRGRPLRGAHFPVSK